MSKGDELKFKKFKWVITRVKNHPFGFVELRYQVKRKYYGIYLSYTKQDYFISPIDWLFYKKRLEKNPNYHYTQK